MPKFGGVCSENLFANANYDFSDFNFVLLRDASDEPQHDKIILGYLQRAQCLGDSLELIPLGVVQPRKPQTLTLNLLRIEP